MVFALCAICVAGGFAAGSWLAGISPNEVDQDVVYQVSTIDALLQGSCEGAMPYGEVKKHGDFGIATFDSLDGEMIAFGGDFYQIKADGQVVSVTDDMTTPFGTVTFFSPDHSFHIAYAANFSDFSRQAEAVLPSRNHLYAVQINGEFPYIKARSIPRQETPNSRLVDAAANQSIFEFRQTRGTVVGFWTPDLIEGLNVPGFHLHYLTEDRTAGGHILDFILENATVEMDITSRFTMVLPDEGSFSEIDLSGDLSRELAVAEKGSA
jgi:acetolactate decarboxylase